MPYRRLLAVVLIAGPWLAGSALAQRPHPGPDAVQAELSDILAFVSSGLIEPRAHPPQVTIDGDRYRITIPLPGLSTPLNAAIEAIAKPLDSGLWDVGPVTLPAAGTMPMAAAGTGPPGTLSFTIGHQAMHGQLDPDLSVASPFAGDFGDVTLLTESDAQRAKQSIEHYSVRGTLSGDPAQRLNLQTQSAATNWRISVTDQQGGTVDSQIHSAAGSFNVEALDRAQARRLAVAARAVATGLQARAEAGRAAIAQPQPPGVPRAARPAPLSPVLREQLRAMVDASAGLLTRLEAEDTARDIRFEAANRGGSIGQVRFGVASEARNDRLGAQLAVTLDDLALSAVPADLVAYVPRHIEFKPAISGLPVGQVLQLLRDATAADPDQPALQAEAIALLNTPDARIGIDSFTVETGPLRLMGSARLLPQAGSMPGVDIHLATTGLDALLAQGQDNPSVQQILPMVFLAKGMARSQGDSLVWDITLRDGVFTVNGTPMGQPPARR